MYPETHDTSKSRLSPRFHRSLFLIICILIFSINQVGAQCVGLPINTFPYNEGFEAGPAWTIKADSLHSDWAWGTPTHPTINTAGGGSKCWMVGSLTGSFYRYKQVASLESPCFDFTALNYPWVSFKIFWEDEWKYDGMSFQSSLDGGLTWSNVGASSDPVDCENTNWFNNANVTWLDSAKWGATFGLPNLGIPKPQGWSGRIGATSGPCQGGNGSGGWITATHCLAGLAGKPSVRFRFIFGAGTTCNSYDGIAIDDILISNAPVEVPNFSSVCAGSNLVNFTNLSTPCTINSTWNFGDPASGASNTSNLLNPSHTFSGPGTFTVMLTSSGTCNAPASVSIPVIVLGSSITPVQINCNGNNNGSATAIPSGGAGPYTYSWTPGGLTTSTISNLAPGNYTVQVSASGACPTSATVTISQPTVLTVSGSTTAASCGTNTGTATGTPSGGTAAYTYSWSPGGAATATITNRPPGNDTCFITDANGCKTSVPLVISSSGSLSSTATPVPSTCNLANGSISTTVAGGTGAYTYSWVPSGGTGPNAINLSAGTYTCNINDALGCTKIDTVILTNTGTLPLASISPSPDTICSGTSSPITASGGGTYSWTSGATTPAISVNAAGTYVVYVSNACGTDSAKTIVTLKSQPAVVNVGPTQLCPGASSILTAPVGNTYSWSTGATTPTITEGTTGTYSVTVTNSCGSSISTYTINVNSVNAFFTADSLSGKSPLLVHFTNGSSPSVNSWSWNFGNGSSSNLPSPSNTFTAPGYYTVFLTVQNAAGCTAVDSVVIHVLDLPSWVSIPNVFTPNGDGSNDIFSISSYGLLNFDMKIYDRWGILMTDFSNPVQGWDGRNKTGILATDGTYYYIMSAKGNDGKDYERTGFLQLIR